MVVGTTVSLLLFGFAHLAGQTPIVGSRPSCAACTLTAEVVATLGEGDTHVGWPSSLVRDDLGRYYLASLQRPGEVAVFHSDGTFLETFGRIGDGPGEYRLIRHLMLVGDSLHVIDTGNRTRTVLALDGSVRSTQGFPGNVESVLFLDDGSFLVNTSVVIPQSVGLSIHRVTRDGTIVQSFDGTGAYRRDQSRYMWRRMTLGGNRDIWVVDRFQYNIKRFGLSAGLLESYHRTVPWFPGDADSRFDRQRAPTPMVEAVRYDAGTRLLWVVSSVADSRWRDQFTSRPDDMAFNGDFGRYLDSIVEVIDPAAGVLVATTRLDLYVRAFLSNGVVYGYELTDQGVPLVRVLRLNLAGGQP